MSQPDPTPPDVAAILARHYHGWQNWSDGSVDHLCAFCGVEWPCETAELAAALQAAQATSARQAAALREAIEALEVYQDTGLTWAGATLPVLRAALAPPPAIPDYLTAPPNARCDGCGRQTYQPVPQAAPCQMPQPDGRRCSGMLTPMVPPP